MLQSRVLYLKDMEAVTLLTNAGLCVPAGLEQAVPLCAAALRARGRRLRPHTAEPQNHGVGALVQSHV